MPERSGNVRIERDTIRAEMAKIVAAAGADGRNVKESIYLAAKRLGLTFRRARAFRARACDAWAYEADRLRRAEPDILRARAAQLTSKIDTIKARLNAQEDRGSDAVDEAPAGPAPAVDW